MRLFTLFSLLFSVSANAQVSRDTIMTRCPVFITDTVSSNNFFIEARPATLKVYRDKGDLTVVVEQRDQFFSVFFHEKRLRNTKYTIDPSSKNKGDVEVSYSFKSGDQVAYIEVSKGSVQSTYDKEKKMWKLKVEGLLSNMADRTVSYYRVRSELWLK